MKSGRESGKTFAVKGAVVGCVRDARPQGRDTAAGEFRGATAARRSWAQSFAALLRAQPDPERSGGHARQAVDVSVVEAGDGHESPEDETGQPRRESDPVGEGGGDGAGGGRDGVHPRLLHRAPDPGGRLAGLRRLRTTRPRPSTSSSSWGPSWPWCGSTAPRSSGCVGTAARREEKSRRLALNLVIAFLSAAIVGASWRTTSSRRSSSTPSPSRIALVVGAW